jgi:hypothetical protein
MSPDPTPIANQGRRRCRELAVEFPDGPTAEMIRDMQDDLLQQLRDLNE